MVKNIATTEEIAPIIAVLIAESFDEKFMPLTRDIPRCMLPLHNTPMIDYTLDFLSVNQVKEAYIVCKSNHEKIAEYLNAKSKWSRHPCMSIKILILKTLNSVGDVFREIYTMNIIRTDFIFISGFVVSNINLEEIFREHQKRRKLDPKGVLTIVVTPYFQNNKNICKSNSNAFVIDSKTKRCLHWENLISANKCFLSIPKEKLDFVPEAEIYSSVVDCGIDICSAEILGCFSDNFDWEKMRADLVKGILESDISEWNIYCQVVHNKYAIPILSPIAYDKVCMDIVERWTFPYVLESKIFPTMDYKPMRNNVYLGKDVDLELSTLILRNTAIGSNSKIGRNTVIKQSSIGTNCKIGANCRIENSYIFGNCVLESNCFISGTIIGYNCTLYSDTKTNPGTIIASNVKYKNKECAKSDFSVLMSVNELMEKFPDMSLEAARSHCLGIIGCPNLPNSENEIVSDSADEESLHECAEDFYAEIQQTLDRSLDMDYNVADAALELSTLKLGMDRSLQDLRIGTFKFLLNRVSSENPFDDLRRIMGKWGELLTRITHTEDDYLDILEVFERHVMANKNAWLKSASKLLYVLYDCDVITEESVNAWHTGLKEDEDSLNLDLWRETNEFINWLEVASEEDGSS